MRPPAEKRIKTMVTMIDTPPRPAVPNAPAAHLPGFRSLRQQFLHLGMVWVLIVVVVAAQIVYPGFLAPKNIGYIISQNAPTGIIAVGMTMVMIAAASISRSVRSMRPAPCSTPTWPIACRRCRHC